MRPPTAAIATTPTTAAAAGAGRSRPRSQISDRPVTQVEGPLVVPETARAGLVDAGAAAWLAEAPGLADACAREWGLRLGYVSDEYRAALIVRSSRSGQPCTLKLFPPTGRFAEERAVLEAAEGRGYTRILDADPERSALLLAPVGPTLESRALAADASDHIVCGVLSEAWLVPTGAGRPAAEPPAAVLAARIEELAAGHDPGGVVVARALAYAQHRLSDDGSREVVLHGHPDGGTVRALHEPWPGAESGYVLVDPEGLLGEPEYDLGAWVAMGNRAVLSSQDPLVDLRARCARVAEATQSDAEAIWQWTMIHRVHRGLAGLAGPDPERGRLFLAAARTLTDRQLR